MVSLQYYFKSKLTMKNVLVINAHQVYPFSEGKLNEALTERVDILD